MKPGYYKELSNSDYHSVSADEGEQYYSSSQLKEMLADPELFYKKYISFEVNDRKEESFFDVGTFFHTTMLEPNKVNSECIVYPGPVRRGKEWEAFKVENKDRTIVTANEMREVDNLVKATKNSPIAMDLLRVGVSEPAFFTELNGVKVKVKLDRLGKGYVLDLKSTTGNVRDAHSIKTKINKYSYDLSAAFYLDVVAKCVKEYKLDLVVPTDFFWIFSSKDEGGNSQTYRATKSMIELGRRKYQLALDMIRKYKGCGWVFEDSVVDLDPLVWDLNEWVKPQENYSLL